MQALWTHSNIYLYNIRRSCSWHVSRIKCWLIGSDNRQSVLWYPQYRCNRSLQQQTLLLPWITSLLSCKSACSLESTTINDSGDSHLAEIKQVHRIFGLFQLMQVMLLGWWMDGKCVTGTRSDISDAHSWSTVINEHDENLLTLADGQSVGASLLCSGCWQKWDW